MKKAWRTHWPLYVSISTLLVTVVIILKLSLRQNQGHLVYALDDAYIHMAMARNLSQHGVWGATRYGFTSTSSSPLWTLLLSLTYCWTGADQVTPLLWNLLFTLLALVAGYAILTWYKVPPMVEFLALLSWILFVPLPMLIFAGMEHGLHTLVSLLAVFVAARWMSGEAPDSARRDFVILLILVPLAASLRFEGMFLVAAIVAILLLTKRWAPAACVGLAGLLPMAIYGFISVSHGWFWFPNSVLLKATLPESSSVAGLVASLFGRFYFNVRQGVHMLVFPVALLLSYILAAGKGRGPSESRQIASAIIALLWTAHLEFVGGSRLYRYDAYLSGLSIVFLASQIPVVAPGICAWLSSSTRRAQRALAYGLLALLFLVLPELDDGRIIWLLPWCTTNIFEQQYQMGRFVQTYYQGSAVALNDIGAVNFLADIHCLDLWGLASLKVAQAKRHHTYGPREIATLSQQDRVKVAIIYDAWYRDLVPPEWLQVGRWTIQNNFVGGEDTVSFYAADPSEAAPLAQHLRDFSARLPADVIQAGSYLSSTEDGSGP